MTADDPREPRFEAFRHERMEPAEKLRVEAPAAEPVGIDPRPGAPEGGTPTRWLLMGIAAAVVLVVVIILASRHHAATTASKPVANPVPAQSTALAPSSATDKPTSAGTASDSKAPEATEAPATPAATPSPPAAPPTPSAAIRTTPTSRVTPPASAPAPRVATAPATLHPPARQAEIAPAAPKHRRRGPSADAPWLIQVGAFKSEAASDSLVKRLVKDGWSARSVDGVGGWHIAEVTGYRTHEEAEHASKQLASKTHLPTLVRHAKLEGKDKTTPAPHPSHAAKPSTH